MVRVHLNNGVVTGVESDDTINAGVGREDEYAATNVSQGLIQSRGGGGASARTYSYRRYIYRPQRLIYPMKRTGPRGDINNANFVRITWDEALTTIATNITQIISQYGPYSIGAWYTAALPVIGYLGAGITGWGIASNESTDFATQYVYGQYASSQDSEITDIFNTKLIVIWGAEPSSTSLSAEIGYYVKLAKEKGIPVIVIDPRYTKSASVYADQWIPMRPGTDVAMMLAIAYQLFANNLYNQSYVSKFVEPTGFQQWQNYVLGKVDGVAKTPQWQENITGVPAQTVIDFATLYAKSNPTYLITCWSPGRQVHGENYARAAIYLQAMMGYIGVPGGYDACQQGGMMRGTTSPASVYPSFYGYILPGEFGNVAASYQTPVLFKNYKWADTVLLKPQFDTGAITKQEYFNAIGNDMSNPTPNLKMAWFNSNLMNQTTNINKEIEAVKAMDFVVSMVWHMDQPTGQLADIVLPRAEVWEEDPTFVSIGISGFQFAPKVIQPPGEVQSALEIMVQLANQLGVANSYAPQLASVTAADWDSTLSNFAQTSYEAWASASNVTTSWADFLKSPAYRVPITTPVVGYADQIQNGKAFPTASGKIEFYSSVLAQGDTYLETTKYGGHIDPYATYVDIAQGYFDSSVSTYPLMAISGHGRYRLHSWQDGDPMLREDVYRHSVWISVADAQQRGISDGDQVRVYNDTGQIVLPAYVTSKIVPGTVNICEGGWFTPNASGVDMRGAPNAIFPDTANPDGQWPFHGLVEVELI
jgi:anaerobic dimethyl sulfoxide reductase subunit A